MPGRAKQKNNPMDDIYEEIHESEPKAMEIMTFVLTREQANTFREKQGKASRKIRWSDITVRVFV
jgi:Spy/CpxP family protein refolding chaperone